MQFTATAIELRHLRYLVAVAEELHFGRAAQRLHIAQPPLSHAIRRLEDELGVLLFERTSRAVKPTEAGLVLAREARTVLSRFDRAVSEARRAGGAMSPLRIACAPHLPIERLVRFIDALRARGVDVGSDVRHVVTSEQVRLLRRGELDLGIYPLAGEQPGLEQESLFAGEPLALYVARRDPLAAKRALAPRDVRGETLAIFPRATNPPLHDRWLALLEAAGFRFRDVREFNGVDGRDLVLAVTEGMSVALAPAAFAEADSADGLVFRRPFDPPLAMDDTVVAWLTNGPRRMGRIVDAVREVARELRRAPLEGGEARPGDRDSGPIAAPREGIGRAAPAGE